MELALSSTVALLFCISVFCDSHSDHHISHFDPQSLSNHLQDLNIGNATAPDIVAWRRSVHQEYTSQNFYNPEQSGEDAQILTSAMESAYTFQGVSPLSTGFEYGTYTNHAGYTSGTYDYDDTHDAEYQQTPLDQAFTFHASGFQGFSRGHQSVAYEPMGTNASNISVMQPCGSLTDYMDPAVSSANETNYVVLPPKGMENGVYGAESATEREKLTSQEWHHSQNIANFNGAMAYPHRQTATVSQAHTRYYPGSNVHSASCQDAKHSNGYSSTQEACSPANEMFGNSTDCLSQYYQPQGSTPESSDTADSFSSDENESVLARKDPLYTQKPDKDTGLYRCPFKEQEHCDHKPTKQKCSYDKYVDSHLKPYRCKQSGCEELKFSSTACRLRHEREAHGSHGHGLKPYLCIFPDCERSKAGNGFPRSWNCNDHMKRMHDYEAASSEENSSGSPPEQPVVPASNDQVRRKRSAQDTARSSSDKRQRSAAPTNSQARQSSGASSKPHVDEIQKLRNRWREHHQRMHWNVHNIRGESDLVALRQLNTDVTAMQNISQRIQELSS